jgi:hypothetical protein
MKTRILVMAGAALCLLFVGGAPALAQEEKTHTETTTKKTGPGPNVKTKMEWLSGTVEKYEAGKKIKLSGPGGKSYSFDLDGDARVQGTIVVGQMAKVGYSKSADGREHVSVLSDASAGARAEAVAPRAHTESVTKESGPGPDTKVKSEVVIGTIKEYEPGKSITVTGPGDKEHSFALDEGAGLQGTFAVGDRVRVTYTKTSDGDKVTTVEPFRGRK